jgi:hypothetical protein
MPNESFTRYGVGGRAIADEENAKSGILEAVDRLIGSGGTSPLVNHLGGSVQILDPAAQPIDAKITAVSSGPASYAWAEEVMDETGAWALLTGGRTGDATSSPAFDRGGSSTVAVGTHVKLWPQRGGAYYLFDGAVGGSPLTVREVDGTPTVTGVTLISVDQATGRKITDLGGGEAKDENLPATHAQWGVVTTADQVMGDGIKTFSDKVQVNKDLNPGVPGNQFEIFYNTPNPARPIIYTKSSLLGFDNEFTPGNYAGNIQFAPSSVPFSSSIGGFADPAGGNVTCSIQTAGTQWSLNITSFALTFPTSPTLGAQYFVVDAANKLISCPATWKYQVGASLGVSETLPVGTQPIFKGGIYIGHT